MYNLSTPRDYPMLDESPAEEAIENLACIKLVDWFISLCPAYGNEEASIDDYYNF